MLVELSSCGGEVGDLLLQGLVEELLIHLKLAVDNSEYLFLERGLKAVEAGQKRPCQRVVLLRWLMALTQSYSLLCHSTPSV